MTDCEEIYANGTRTDGLYYVSPDGRCPFLVYCDMTHGGWTVIQVRGIVLFWNTYFFPSQYFIDKTPYDLL